jgi:serine/threonine-protein kinase
MRTCSSCGFENAEPGKSCPLCGASETFAATQVAGEATLVQAPGGRPASPETTALGRVFGARYRVDALLGRGGMGEVYRVHDLTQGVDRALKILHPAIEDDPDRIERFRREIGILSKLRHPAIPRIHDWGADRAELYFVSDLVDGRDLKIVVQERGPWPAADAAALIAAVADALAAAHAQGIVHRDVKPNNVMIAADGAVRLLDFGLARGVGIDMSTLTRTGMIVGTPGYMSPEQFDGQVDERTDVYSLGVVLYEMTTGRLPFTGPTPIAVAMKHKTETPVPPRALRRDLPAWLERIILRCLEKDPAGRFTSAAELAAELRRPRRGGRPRLRRLATGDAVVEDESESSDWALVLSSPEEKTGWTVGMALRYGGGYYRLEETLPRAPGQESWTYRFSFWPAEQVFRRIVDYEQDAADRRAASERSLKGRLQRWIGSKGSES